MTNILREYEKMIKLKKKLVKSGNGIAFSIPKAFITEGLLKEGIEYEITIREANLEDLETSSNDEKKLPETWQIQKALETENEEFLENLKK